MHLAAVPAGDAHAPIETDPIVGGSHLLGELCGPIRRKRYRIRTEACLQWARCLILFHGKRHSGEMGEARIVAFLDHLAGGRNVAASPRNQAVNALVFL